MWKKILFNFPSRRYATHTHNSYLETTIVLHFLPAFLSLEPFFFQPGLSTHRSSRAAFDKPYTHAHTHTHVPFKQANRVRSVLRISSRYSLPPYLCHRFHLLRGRRSPLSPLFTVPLDQQFLPRRLISFHRQTTMSIITSIVEPSSFTDHGRKIGKKRNIYTKLECVYLYRWKNLHKSILSQVSIKIERKMAFIILFRRNELWCANKID